MENYVKDPNRTVVTDGGGGGGGSGGGSGSGDTSGGSGSNQCSTVTNACMKVTDSMNSNRYVTGSTSLVMVEGSGMRTANFNILGTSGSPYVNWTSGMTHGQSTTANGSQNADLYPYTPTSSTAICKTLVGNVTIVAENKIIIENEVSEINNKIAELTSTVKNTLQTITCGSAFTFDVSLTGSGEIRNVDKYADGTKSGKFIGLTLGGIAKFDFPHFESPSIPVFEGISVKGGLTLGSASGSASVAIAADESKSSQVSITGGNLEVKVNAASADLSVIVGEERICSGKLTGTISCGQIVWTGKISYENNQLIMKSSMNGAALYVSAKASILAFGGTVCQLQIFDNKQICSIPAKNFNNIVLIQN